jgi:hypothetical protein
VITQESVAVIELSDDTTTMQAGVRPGEGDAIYVAEQLVRLRDASAKSGEISNE